MTLHGGWTNSVGRFSHTGQSDTATQEGLGHGGN